MKAAASSSETKRSKVTTHGPFGGRESTVARSSGRATNASKVASIPPLTFAGAFAPVHEGLIQPHESHASAHCVRMKPSLASHSPRRAQSVHAVCSFRHGLIGSESCTIVCADTIGAPSCGRAIRRIAAALTTRRIFAAGNVKGGNERPFTFTAIPV